jgi:hypothetical protein
LIFRNTVIFALKDVLVRERERERERWCRDVVMLNRVPDVGERERERGGERERWCRDVVSSTCYRVPGFSNVVSST